MPVFISYSQADTPLYSTVCYALDAKGLPRWDVKSMSVGLSLADQLKNAINMCDVCVFIATRRSIQSTWCMAEMGAFWGIGKTVAIFVADSDIGKDDLPPQFAENLRTDDFAKLIETIDRSLPPSERASDTAQILYRDVDDVLNLLEKEEIGKEVSYKVRKGLNELFLSRNGQLSVELVKEALHAAKLYERSEQEKSQFDASVNHMFIDAVRQFQVINRIDIKDGIVGPQTAHHLIEACIAQALIRA